MVELPPLEMDPDPHIVTLWARNLYAHICAPHTHLDLGWDSSTPATDRNPVFNVNLCPAGYSISPNSFALSTLSAFGYDTGERMRLANTGEHPQRERDASGSYPLATFCSHVHAYSALSCITGEQNLTVMS